MDANGVLSDVYDATNHALKTTGGAGGGGAATIADGADLAEGATTDAESSSGNGSVVAILKRLRTLLNGGLPAALSAGGGVKVGNVDALPAGTNMIGSVRAEQYTAPVSGELAGSTSALQLPSVACKLVRFKAATANAGKVYVGVSGVTKVDGTTDTTTGLQLAAGDDTGWIPVDNLNRFYRICDNAGDALTYLALA